jgi:hypothetical protein
MFIYETHNLDRKKWYKFSKNLERNSKTNHILMWMDGTNNVWEKLCLYPNNRKKCPTLNLFRTTKELVIVSGRKRE